MRFYLLVLICLFFVFQSSCTLFPHSYSHTNVEIQQQDEGVSKASFYITHDRGQHKKALVVLALSGGGSRSAYWASSVMLALGKVYENHRLNILEEVDIISSVSGGSLPAAYYTISKDPGVPKGKIKSERIWREDIVKELMSRNYRRKWILNSFWPNNIFKYWFTAFDRSDIMAQTFADNLYDVAIIGTSLGEDLRFKDINPERPNLVLNSTNGTGDAFAEIFPFTEDRFERINSDIGQYEIGRAVMATAAFPAAFNYMTLQDYAASEKDQQPRFIHVFDGGNADNLGLKSSTDIFKINKDQYSKYILILIDSYTKNTGVESSLPDARAGVDFAVDMNFLDSLETLLANNRDNLIDKTIDVFEDLGRQVDKNGKNPEYIFYHIRFEDIRDHKLRKDLNKIKTDFKISKANIQAIDEAVKKLIMKENDCLTIIKDIVLEETTEHQMSYCIWQN